MAFYSFNILYLGNEAFSNIILFEKFSYFRAFYTVLKEKYQLKNHPVYFKKCGGAAVRARLF